MIVGTGWQYVKRTPGRQGTVNGRKPDTCRAEREVVANRRDTTADPRYRRPQRAAVCCQASVSAATPAAATASAAAAATAITRATGIAAAAGGTSDVTGAVPCSGARARPGRAVQHVAEPVFDTQLPVDGEQQRQPLRGRRVDALLRTSQPPGSLDALLRQRGRTHGFGRGVMQKTPQPLLTELLVCPREHDELVPGDVHHLGRHRNHFPPGPVADMEVVAQTVEHEIHLGIREIRILVADLLADRRVEVVMVDESQLLPGPGGEQEIANAGNRRQYEQD